MCLHEKPFELETSEDITKVFRNEEMEDEEMEFMDGTWKKEINTWEELVGNNLLNQEAVIEALFTASVIWVMWHLSFLEEGKVYSRQSMKMKWQMFPFMN